MGELARDEASTFNTSATGTPPSRASPLPQEAHATQQLGQPSALAYAATHHFSFSVDFPWVVVFQSFCCCCWHCQPPRRSTSTPTLTATPPTATSHRKAYRPRRWSCRHSTASNANPRQPGHTTSPANRDEPRDAYEILELTDIPTEQALRANNGTFTVGVRAQPRLRSPHLFRLLLDGQPYGQPSNVPRLQLVNIDRGEHSLAVQVIDGDTLVQQSETVTFTVQRVHQP